MTLFHKLLNLLLAPQLKDYVATAKVQKWAINLVSKNSIALNRVILKSLTLALDEAASEQGKIKASSFNRSALWALANKRYGSKKDYLFEQLATEMLKQVGLCAKNLALARGYDTPIYTRAVELAGSGLDKLMNLTPEQLKAIYQLYALSDRKDALNPLIERGGFSAKITNNLGSLQSLQNLAYGHRNIRSDAGSGLKKAPLARAVEFKSVELTDEEIEQGITDFSVTYTSFDDEYLGEAPHDNEQLCFTTVNFQKINANYPNRTLTIPQLMVKGAQLAKQRARANSIPRQDLRWLETAQLEKIDRYITGNNCAEYKALVLAPLITGRSLKSLTKSIFDAKGDGVIRLSVNSPRCKKQEYAQPVCPYVDVPIPQRWKVAFEEIKSHPGSTLSKIFRSTNTQKKLLKTIDSELTEVKLRHFMPLSLKLNTRYDSLAYLLADSITSTDLTRQHYLCLLASDAQDGIAEMWSRVERDLDNPQGVTSYMPQKGFIGSSNNPDPKSVDDWLSDNPVDNFHDIRQRLVSEGMFMAHRGVIDPTADVIIDSSSMNAAILNDKDRGGKKQMTRLALLSRQQLQLLQNNNRVLTTLKYSGSSPCLGHDARCWDLERNKPLVPSRLQRASPQLPGPANSGRKILASQSENLPVEYLAIHMGWLSHGTVPFSIYSTMSPLHLSWASGVMK